jgi:putative PIG3 family NAD(P)H quinone oxidoreductase
MKQIACGPEGTIESMHLVDAESPEPRAGEILVEVACAGVNRPDLFQRSGRYPPPPGASPILGLEVAGRVVALGEGVTEWCVGDRIAALAPGGGYAEYCVVPAAHALAVPDAVRMTDAAALPEVWFTVWANLMDIGHLGKGERLLVHGGSSGIGLAAIQLARYVGAEIIVTVGSAEKAAFCRDFGAAFAINYRQEDFLEKAREITSGEGVDVVLDMVGGSYLQKNVSLLRRDGRLVLIAFLEGSRTEFDFLPLMMKRLTISGSTMRSRTLAEKAAIRDALRENVWPSLMDGRLKSHVCATFPLAQAGEAHRLMESSHHIGKIVLQVR